LVSTTSESPAFQPANLVLAARAARNNLYAAAEGSTEVAVQAGYLPFLEVTTPYSQFKIPPGQAASPPVTVTNLGNGPTRVSFVVLEAPRGVTVTLPPAHVLGARRAGDRSNIKTFFPTLTTDGSFEAGRVLLQAVGVYADQPDDPRLLHEEKRLALVIAPDQAIVGRATHSVPAIESAGWVAVVAAIAWARRR
jgi:hypothetical protein